MGDLFRQELLSKVGHKWSDRISLCYMGENFQFRRPHVMLLLRRVHPFSIFSLKKNFATYRGVGLAGSDPVRLRGKRGEKSLLLFRYAWAAFAVLFLLHHRWGGWNSKTSSCLFVPAFSLDVTKQLRTIMQTKFRKGVASTFVELPA